MGFHQAGMGICATCLQKHRRAGMWETVSTRAGSAFLLDTRCSQRSHLTLFAGINDTYGMWEGVCARAEHLRTRGRARSLSLDALCSRGSHLTLLADIEDTHAGIPTQHLVQVRLHHFRHPSLLRLPSRAVKAVRQCGGVDTQQKRWWQIRVLPLRIKGKMPCAGRRVTSVKWAQIKSLRKVEGRGGCEACGFPYGAPRRNSSSRSPVRATFLFDPPARRFPPAGTHLCQAGTHLIDDIFPAHGGHVAGQFLHPLHFWGPWPPSKTTTWDQSRVEPVMDQVPPARPPPERPPPEMPGLYGPAAETPVGASVHRAPRPLWAAPVRCESYSHRRPCVVVLLIPTRSATRVAATFGLENLHAQVAPRTPPPSQTAPRTPHMEAAERIGKRYKEMLESECQLCEDMEKLITTLTATSQVPQATSLPIAARWPLGCA